MRHILQIHLDFFFCLWYFDLFLLPLPSHHSICSLMSSRTLSDSACIFRGTNTKTLIRYQSTILAQSYFTKELISLMDQLLNHNYPCSSVRRGRTDKTIELTLKYRHQLISFACHLCLIFFFFIFRWWRNERFYKNSEEFDKTAQSL